MIQVGGSSRTYRLHWLPLSQAYASDSYCPVISASDVTMSENEENENAMVSHHVVLNCSRFLVNLLCRQSV